MSYTAGQSSTPYYQAYKLPESVSAPHRPFESALPGYFTVSALGGYSNHHSSSIPESTGESHGAKRRVAFSPAQNGVSAGRAEISASNSTAAAAFRSPVQPQDAPFYTHPGAATGASQARQRDGPAVARGTAGALAKLTDELDSVRSAWRTEGQDLRSKMMQLHEARLRAEEETLRLEVAKKDSESDLTKKIEQLLSQNARLSAKLEEQADVGRQAEARHTSEAVRLRHEVEELLHKLASAELQERHSKYDILQLENELAVARDTIIKAREETEQERKAKEAALQMNAMQVLDAKHTISAEKVTAAEHRADHMARIGTLEATIQMLRDQLEQQRKSFEATLASTKEDSHALQQSLTQQLEGSRRALELFQDEANLRAADLVAEIQHLKTINQELRIANSAFHEALTAAENEFASVADAVADFSSRDSPSRSRRPVPLHPSMRSIKARDAGFLATTDTRRDSSMSDSTASMHEPISNELRSHLNRTEH